MKKQKFNFHPSLFNINTWVSIATIALSIFLLFNIYSYIGLSVVLFSIGIVILILLNALSAFLDLASKDHNKLRYPSIIFAALLLLFVGFANYYVIRLHSSISGAIVDTTKTQYEDITTSFVAYDTDAYTSLSDIENKNVGIINSTEFQEGNVLPTQLLTDQNINVNYVEYPTYNDMLLALFNNEIDVASLPEAYYSMFIGNEGYEEYLDLTTAFYSFTTEVAIEGQVASDKNITSEPFTVLLIGNADGLSDTLILATFNPRTMTATMTSIARDTYAPIACYTDQASDKITHARSVSRQCTIDTVSNFLDVDIDYFAEVNFQAIVDIVDALGGLYLYSPVEFVGQDASSERGHFTVWVDEGWQVMDGLQTLAFARERHAMPNGDLDRQEHQQQVIEAIIAKIMETKDITTLLNVVDAAGSNIKTNISLNDLTQLGQFLIKQMSSTTIDSQYLLQMKSSRVTGYFSWMYSDTFQLPLSIYKAWEGSIEFNKNLIYQNLMIDYQINDQKIFSFNIESPYATPDYIIEWYDEPQVHEKLPDFMPSMTSSTNIWTLSDVQSWAASRSWINVTYDEIWPGEDGYSENYLYNRIISQSVRYGIKTENFSSLTVGVIKHELDCAIVENRSDPQCAYIVPDFTGMTIAQANSWSSANNFPINIVYLREGDAGYSTSNIGKIGSQKESAYTKLSQVGVSSLTIYTADYPYEEIPYELIFNSEDTWLKTDFETWVKEHLYNSVSYEYETSYSTTHVKDEIVSIYYNDKLVTQNTTMFANETLRVVLSIGPFVNTAPVASAKTVEMLDTDITLTGQVSATDVDASQTLTYSAKTQPTHGTLVLNPNGLFTYTVTAGYTGTDSFTFVANDGTAESNIATVTINITADAETADAGTGGVDEEPN